MAVVSIPTVIGGMLAFTGVLLVLGGLYEYYTRKRSIEKSDRVSATVLSSEVSEHTGVYWRETYKPSVEFEYTYSGQKHTSDDLYPSVLDENTGYDWTKRIVENHPEGETVTAYVDPENPDRAFLEEGSGRGKVTLTILELTGLVLAGIGAVILFPI